MAYKLKDRERTKGQREALKRIGHKKAAASKRKVTARDIVAEVERRTRVTQAAAAGVLNATGVEAIELQLNPKAVMAVESTLDQLLA